MRFDSTNIQYLHPDVQSVQNSANPLPGRSMHYIQFTPIRVHNMYLKSSLYPLDKLVHSITVAKTSVHIAHQVKTELQKDCYHPLIKKASPPDNELENYHPMSRLHFLST